jgi:hypothetical protein
MAKEDLIKRDGSAQLGSPRPRIAPRPSKSNAVQPRHDARYADHSTVGWYDERDAFEAAAGTPSPRQRAARGESFGEHVTPDRSEELIRKAAPLS